MFKHLVVTALDHHCIRHSLEVNIHYTPCHNHFVKMISPSQKNRCLITAAKNLSRICTLAMVPPKKVKPKKMSWACVINTPR